MVPCTSSSLRYMCARALCSAKTYRPMVRGSAGRRPVELACVRTPRRAKEVTAALMNLSDSRTHNTLAQYSSHPQRDAGSSTGLANFTGRQRYGAMCTERMAGTSGNKQLWNPTAHKDRQDREFALGAVNRRTDAQRNHASPDLQAGGRGFEPLTAHRILRELRRREQATVTQRSLLFRDCRRTTPRRGGGLRVNKSLSVLFNWESWRSIAAAIGCSCSPRSRLRSACIGTSQRRTPVGDQS